MVRNEVNLRTKTNVSISFGTKEITQQMHKCTNANYAGKQKRVTMATATKCYQMKGLISRTMAV